MLKRAYIAADPVDAQIVKGLLEAAGLFAVIKGDLAWSARGETPVTDDTAPAVWVLEQHLAEARKLIEQRAQRPDLPDWTCPQCDERLGGQFMQCWKCGAKREEEDRA